MRVLLAALVVSSASTAFADPAERLEAGGFLGVDDFGNNKIWLGHSLAPEQRPQTAPLMGARLTFIALRTQTDIRLDVGLEGELSFAAAWTGYGFEDERPSYFAPVFGFRGNLLVRLGDGWLQPHAVGGAGGATVASSSPYMKKETEAVYFWGLGATIPVSGRWQLRFDGLQTRMAARDPNGTANSPGMTNTYELRLTIGARFGTPAPTHVEPREHVDVVIDTQPKPPQPPVDADTDKDGIPDRLDKCPAEPETVNGIDDDDGCPEADPDHDGIVGAQDKCPDQPEDVDKFQDDDGCPDPDNDNDGVADAKDACPNEPETKNGFADDDGCADTVPAAVVAALDIGAKLQFEKVRIRTASKKALDKVGATLLANRGVKVLITAHPEGADDAAKTLANKRADAVKFYLVEQGVAMAQLDVKVGDPKTAKGPIVELNVSNP